jgi:hypothetical protein
LIYWIFEPFVADETALMTMLAGMMAAAFAWRRLGYERHVRRVAEIKHRIALRHGRTRGP